MTDLYNNDDTLRETIRKFTNDKLNEAGKVEEVQLVDFILGKDFLQTDEDLTQVKQIDGTYKTLKDTFTVGMITDFLGIPEAIKDLKLIAYTLPMVILVSTEKKYDIIKESLERFVVSLIGQDFDENGYIFGTNCTEMTNTEQVQDINGVEYVKYTCTIFITTTKNALLGNRIESYFGEDEQHIVRVYPTDRTTTRAFIPEETQRNNLKESTTIFKESTWQGDLSFVISKNDPVYMALIQHIEEPTFLNKTWYYRVKYGAFENGAFENGTFNKEVGLQGITLDGEIGTYALMSIVMKRSGINIDG
jgi:hypothetical protein